MELLVLGCSPYQTWLPESGPRSRTLTWIKFPREKSPIIEGNDIWQHLSSLPVLQFSSDPWPLGKNLTFPREEKPILDQLSFFPFFLWANWGQYRTFHTSLLLRYLWVFLALLLGSPFASYRNQTKKHMQSLERLEGEPALNMQEDSTWLMPKQIQSGMQFT